MTVEGPHHECSEKGIPKALAPRMVRAIAALLLVGTTLLCFVTPDVGFTRDESFYFRYAESYQGWFTRLAQADKPADVAKVLGRHDTVKTWRGNFEHPPLMKTLFGFSWRLFGQKDRNVQRVRTKDTGPELMISGLGTSDGFEVGSRVRVLAPIVREGPGTSEPREVATGYVTSRKGRQAVVWIPGKAKNKVLKTACKPEAGERAPKLTIRGCQVTEQRALAIMSESDAMRFPGYLSLGLTVMLTFLMGCLLFSWPVALFGAMAFLWVPRHFFHGHMACFDMPIVAATLFVFYAFWRSLSDRRWALGAGIAWGLALLVKHNAFFLPFPLILVWLWFGRDELRLTRRGWRLNVQLPKLPLAFLTMPVIGLTMLVVFWPRIWYDPVIALSDYFGFHLKHVHYFQWYFGEPLQVVPFPFEFPFALTFYTVPEALLLLFVVGMGILLAPSQWKRVVRGIKEGTPPGFEEKRTVYALLNGLFPIFLIALPTVPIFGGVKHWMTGMPLLMLVAGYGLMRVLTLAYDTFKIQRLRGALTAAFASIILIAPAAESIAGLPFGTGYYNSVFAGGSQGAADRHMMRLYWGQTTAQALDWVNDNAPKNARVYFQNTPHRAVDFYKREGRLRSDIRPVWGPHGASIALVEPQKSFVDIVDRDVRKSFGVAGPVKMVAYEGVNMLRIYQRPQRVPAVAVPATPRPLTKPLVRKPKRKALSVPKAPSKKRALQPGRKGQKPTTRALPIRPLKSPTRSKKLKRKASPTPSSWGPRRTIKAPSERSR